MTVWDISSSDQYILMDLFGSDMSLSLHIPPPRVERKNNWSVWSKRVWVCFLQKFVDRASRKYSRDNASVRIENSNRNNPLPGNKQPSQGTSPSKRMHRGETRPKPQVEW